MKDGEPPPTQPDLPEGGESSPHRCALERPAVAWAGAEEPAHGEDKGDRGARGERSAGGEAGATLEVAAGFGMNVGVGLVEGWAPGGREGGGEARAISLEKSIFRHVH